MRKRMVSGLLFSVLEAEQSGYFGSDGSVECFLETTEVETK